MKINVCLRCSHEWPSKLEKSRTCAKCRSPYWDVAKGSVAEKITAEASPVIDRVPTIPAPVEKEELSDLQSLIDSIHAKKIKPILAEYPSTPADQPDDYSEPTRQYD